MNSIVQDVALYVLPIYIVWNLQMPRRQKFALAALLCVGLIAVAGLCTRYSERLRWIDTDSQKLDAFASTMCSSLQMRQIFGTTWPIHLTGAVLRSTSVGSAHLSKQCSNANLIQPLSVALHPCSRPCSRYIYQRSGAATEAKARRTISAINMISLIAGNSP